MIFDYQSNSCHGQTSWASEVKLSPFNFLGNLLNRDLRINRSTSKSILSPIYSRCYLCQWGDTNILPFPLQTLNIISISCHLSSAVSCWIWIIMWFSQSNLWENLTNNSRLLCLCYYCFKGLIYFKWGCKHWVQMASSPFPTEREAVSFASCWSFTSLGYRGVLEVVAKQDSKPSGTLGSFHF